MTALLLKTLKTTTEPVWGSELMVPRRIQALDVFGMA